MKEAAKSKARKVFQIVQWIVFIYAIIFLAGGVFKAFTYSGYYDEPAKTMLTEHNGDQQFLWHMVSEMSGALQADLVMFSGNSEVGKLTVAQNGTLTITPTVRTGKAKVLLLNRENKIVFSGEPARSGQAVSVTPGTYRAVIVGRWFTGNILFEMPDPLAAESNVTVLSGPSPYLRESLHASGAKSEAGEASVIYPEPADETGRFIAAALIEQRRPFESGARHIYIVRPEVKKVSGDGTRQRIFCYVAFGAFSPGDNGAYRLDESYTAPFEIYAETDPITGELSTYCALPAMPLAGQRPDDASKTLKEEIQKTASPEAAKRALDFLNGDGGFMASAWSDMVGKPLETATAEELSAALQEQLRRMDNLYAQTLEEYGRMGAHVLA